MGKQKNPKPRPKDVNQLAKLIVDIATTTGNKVSSVNVKKKKK